MRTPSFVFRLTSVSANIRTPCLYHRINTRSERPSLTRSRSAVLLNNIHNWEVNVCVCMSCESKLANKSWYRRRNDREAYRIGYDKEYNEMIAEPLMYNVYIYTHIWYICNRNLRWTIAKFFVNRSSTFSAIRINSNWLILIIIITNESPSLIVIININ